MQPNEIDPRWLQLRATRDAALREQLILQYAPLVRYVAARTPASLPGLVGPEDVLSYGTIGLIQAVDRFDPTQGVKFETYAIRRIRGSILDAIRGLQPASRETTRRARELEQAFDLLAQQLGRAPEEREVADQLGLSLEELRALLVETSVTTVSLDAPLAGLVEGEHTALADQLVDEDQPTVEEAVDRRQLERSLARAIEQLPERDRLVITFYYYEDLSLKEIGAVLEVSVSRVSQLHAAAVLKLRGLLRAARTQADGQRPAA